MGKILVKKSVDVQYPVSGAPILVTGGGGGGGASPRGMTLQEALGRIGGGTLGALAAATGQHRSLGSLAQGMVSGAAQGKAIGGGLGRIATTRAGQQRANLREKLKQKEAEEKAAKQIARWNRGEGFLTNLLNPIGAYNRRVADREAGRLDFARQMNQEAEDYSRNMAELYRNVGREQFNQIRRPQLQQKRAELLAAAKARGGKLGAEQKRKLEMLDSLIQRTGAPDLPQALAILGAVNQTASPPPAQVDNAKVTAPEITNQEANPKIDPSEMSEAQQNAIKNTMARRNEKLPATEESHPIQQEIETAFSNVLATQKPETGNPFDNSAMANSTLATQGLGAANMVAQPSDGVVAETTADKQAENSQMNLDTTPEQNLHSLFEALGPPREARSPEPIGTGYSGKNPNVEASKRAAARMDDKFYQAQLAAAEQMDRDNLEGFVGKSEPMELAFRLLKMMVFSR